LITLGVSAFYHDSAAAIIRDSEIVAAAQEERFSRKKADSDFPIGAIAYCLKEAGVTLNEVDYVSFYDKPLLTFNRLLETYLAFAPRGFPSFVKAIPVWVKEKIFQKSLIEKELNNLGQGSIDPSRIVFDFHHHSHAASAFYPSPFQKAAILIMDGVGEWATTSCGIGDGEKLELTREIRFPHSLGLLYSAFTYYLGFKVNDGEYKVMGLAPYGAPTFVDQIRDNLIDIRDDGSFWLDMQYFDYCTGLTMTNKKFDDLFGGPPRNPAAPLTQRDMDLARSVQVVTEEAVLALARALHRETGMADLCLAGGVALNCVANGRLLREGPFDRIWIQPAAGDAGGAIGAALAVNHLLAGVPRPAPDGRDGMKGAYLGPAYDSDEIRGFLDGVGASYDEPGEEGFYDTVSAALAGEKIVGWFQGRSEFGPRALGNRSILGDARSERMQSMLNLKIKYRESFRPFAPAVLSEDTADYFGLEGDSPYMLVVAPVREERRTIPAEGECTANGLDKLMQIRSDVPAITHVDYSARVQTVDGVANPQFRRLLEAYKARTGYGLLVNTSFNVRDEPIVCSPEDAWRCFMATEMDMLAIGPFVLHKENQ
jgi:carbamoyltransferase